MSEQGLVQQPSQIDTMLGRTGTDSMREAFFSLLLALTLTSQLLMMDPNNRELPIVSLRILSIQHHSFVPYHI